MQMLIISNKGSHLLAPLQNIINKSDPSDIVYDDVCE